MTIAQMEQRLLALSEQFVKTRDPTIRREYQQLHEEYKKAKGSI